jgi:quercetin dioxygenase-like cupin family protein
MQYARGRGGTPVQLGTAFAPHTGNVLLDALVKDADVFVNAAVYAPCARTYWHVHERGQVILVTSGEGVIATRDGDVRLLRPGDVAYSPAGEEHWHGAAPDCFVTYTSVSLGSTETYGEVSGQEYGAVWEQT